MSVQLDEGRQAHLDRVMERRRREGRSTTTGGASRSSIVSGARLGNVVPASFPPTELSRSTSTPTRGGGGGGSDHQKLLEIQNDARRQVEAQKAIAAQSEAQLLWQRKQLEQMLGSTTKVEAIEQRLRGRELKIAQEEAAANQKLADERQQVMRRLRQREEAIDAATVGSVSPAKSTMSAYPYQPQQPPTPDRTVTMLQQRVTELERKLAEQPRPVTPSPGRSIPAELRRDLEPPREPSMTTTTFHHDPGSFMKPGHTRDALRSNLGDPIFTPDDGRDPTPWIGPQYHRPPSPVRSRSFAGGSMVYAGEADPVFEHQGPARDDSNSRNNAYYPPHEHTVPARSASLAQSLPGSPLRAQERIRQQTLAANSAPHVSYAPNPNLPPPQPHYNPVVTKAMHQENILHDMKAGDWFIKWTKNDKPHRRWFWLNQSKMLLYWSNTQSASVLMSNNIKLEQVVSIRAEQLTEESPGDPGNPQLFYLMTIVIFKRNLQIACRSREKFNKWFEGLNMLTQQYRQVNEVAYAQQANPALSRVMSRQAITTAVSRTAAVSAAD